MSEILRNWVNGLGLPDVLVIDGHIHIGEWPCATTFHSVEEAVEKSVTLMDAYGVDACCAVSGGYLWGSTDYRLGNDFLLSVWQKIPERLIPFASINPNDAQGNILAELDRVFQAGVRGIKLINAYQDSYPGDGPNLMAVYQYAAKRGMIVFNHSWHQEVIMKISEQVPDTIFIFGHYAEGQNPVLKARENVYANMWNMGSLGWLNRGIKEVGAGKFVMGSDGFLNPLSVGIGPVVFAPISDDEKRLILGLTMARLLDRVGALPAALKERYL